MKYDYIPLGNPAGKDLSTIKSELQTALPQLDIVISQQSNSITIKENKESVILYSDKGYFLSLAVPQKNGILKQIVETIIVFSISFIVMLLLVRILGKGALVGLLFIFFYRRIKAWVLENIFVGTSINPNYENLAQQVIAHPESDVHLSKQEVCDGELSS